MTAHLLLVRHARSSANTAGVLAGRMPDVHLDEVGVEQAMRLRDRLADVTITQVVGSPLERCRETADPLRTERELDYVVTDGLNECDYGSWSGRSLAECATDPLWKTIQERPARAQFPGGESLQQMASRASSAMRQWMSNIEDGSIVMAVSHGDVIKAIVADALGLALDEFQKIVIDPASITVLRYAPERTFLIRLNDSHEPIARLLSGPAEAAVGGGSGAGGHVLPDRAP